MPEDRPIIGQDRGKMRIERAGKEHTGMTSKPPKATRPLTFAETRLTPSEIEALRQDMREASAFAKKWLAENMPKKAEAPAK